MLKLMIGLYRLLPGVLRVSCPRAGLSCSQLALLDGTWAGALGVIRSCGKCSEVPYPKLPGA